MEVNHEKLPSLAALGLIALRSGGDSTTGPLFSDCLCHREAAAPARSESSPPPLRPTDNEPSSSTGRTTDAAVPTEELETSPEEERDSEEPTANAPSTSVTPATVNMPLGQAELAVPEEPHEALVSAEVEADEKAGAAQLSLLSATEPTPAADEEPVAGSAATAAELSTVLPEANGPQADTTKVQTEKSKRGKVRVQSAGESIDSTSESHVDKSSQPASKPSLQVPHQPEIAVEPGPPEVAPLDVSPADDRERSTVAKELVAAATDNQPPPAAEPNTALPTVDPVASATQLDANHATGAVAATSKPPAALLKSKATPSDAARSAGEIDPARFLSRVVKAFESAHQRSSEVRLRLHPVELGALSIEIKVQDSVLTASVQAETPDAKAAIVENLPALRERLADQGIRIDKFDVDLMDHSDRRQQSLEEQARRQEDRQASAPRGASRRPVSSEPQPGRPAHHRTNGQNGLNVVI